MRSPTGAEPRAVRSFGEAALGSRVVTGDHVVEVPVDPQAPIYDRLAGWFGRDPDWTPPD